MNKEQYQDKLEKMKKKAFHHYSMLYDELAAFNIYKNGEKFKLITDDGIRYRWECDIVKGKIEVWDYGKDK